MSDIPEHLLRRSAEAKAKALGIPVEQVLAEMTGEAPVTAMDAGDQPKVETVEAAPQTPAESPAPAAQDAPQTDAAVDAVVEEQAEAAAASPSDGAGGEIDYEAAAAKAGMPASLLQRSVEAKAKASGASAAQVLAEMLGEEAPSAAPATAPAPEPAPAEPAPEPEPTSDAVSADVIDMPPTIEAAPAAATSAPAASAPPPATGGATAVAARPIAQPEAVPEGVRTQRLLTVVKANAIQQVKAEPTDKVSTWPHLMIMEFAVLLGVTALLIVLSVILQAPLLESANFNATPNPSKAPWYFLGLQELLSYFDPQIAGVTVPTIIGLVGFMAIPYVDKNPSNKPSDRKFAIFMYTFFMMGAATLTILGVLFRGPGFNFTYPWVDGIFFDDLKDWVNFE